MIWEFVDEYIIICMVLIGIVVLLVSFAVCLAVENNLEVKGCGGYNSFEECSCSKDCIELGYTNGTYKFGNAFKSSECWCRGVKGIVQIS